MRRQAPDRREGARVTCPEAVTRRGHLALLAAMAGAGALSAVPRAGAAQAIAVQGAAGAEPAEPTPPERAAMAQIARDYMQKYTVPGMSVAIGHGGRIIYAEAFGVADRERPERLMPSHLFRIASVSKPITSVAIFSLIEQGRLNLGERVFGPGGVLGTDYGGPPFSPGVEQITIEHLLTHTCGGWGNDHDDPMFMNPGMNHAQLISWTLHTKPLEHPPGQKYSYSNFGFCVLGRVIEKVARQPYAAFVSAAVLRRCGIADMAIAGNTLAARRPGEVRYYGQDGENPYDMNVARMDSHGGGRPIS